MELEPVKHQTGQLKLDLVNLHGSKLDEELDPTDF